MRKAKVGKKKSSRRSKVLKVDFTGIEAGGKSLPDGGPYRFKVEDVEQKEGNDSGEPYLNWKVKTIAPKKHAGVTVYDTTSLQPQALWKLRGLLEAMGVEVPDGAMEIDPSDYIGEEFSAKVVNEEWEGRDRPKIASYVGEGDEEEDSEDEEEDEDSEDEEDTEEDEDEDSEEEEDEEDEEDEDESPAAKKRKRQAARRAARKNKDEDEEEDSEDEEEEEDEEETSRSSKKKGSKGKFVEGDKVSFKEGNKTYKGKVIEVDGNIATIDVKGEEWQVEFSDLTKI